MVLEMEEKFYFILEQQEAFCSKIRNLFERQNITIHRTPLQVSPLSPDGTNIPWVKPRLELSQKILVCIADCLFLVYMFAFNFIRWNV